MNYKPRYPAFLYRMFTYTINSLPWYLEVLLQITQGQNSTEEPPAKSKLYFILQVGKEDEIKLYHPKHSPIGIQDNNKKENYLLKKKSLRKLTYLLINVRLMA